MEGLGSLVIEERMRCAVIGLHDGDSAMVSDGCGVPGNLRSGRGHIRLTLMDDSLTAAIGVPRRVILRPRHRGVEGHRAVNVRAHGGRQQRKTPTHAKTHGTHPVGGEAAGADEIARCRGEVRRRLRNLQAHHQFVCLIRLGRRSSAIQIRCEGDESLLGKTVAHRADVRDQAPPLLDDDHTGSPMRAREG